MKSFRTVKSFEEPDIVTQACNVSLEKLKQENREFQISLDQHWETPPYKRWHANTANKEAHDAMGLNIICFHNGLNTVV